MNNDNKITLFTIIIILIFSLFILAKTSQPITMPIDTELNNTLKTMWSIQEDWDKKIPLSKDKMIFYNQNLHVIQEYYKKNMEEWTEQLPFSSEVIANAK